MDDPSVRPLTDDFVLPFQIEASRLRGRIVKLGPAIDEILTRHDYPPTVARFLAETATLAVLLASMLKYEGIFTLQTKGDGPIRLMVADVTSVGDVRAYAQFDPEALAKAERDVDIAPAAALLGKGYIAFTVDQGQDTDRYQGIVELYGKTLTDCVQHYFRQSEQIDTGLTVSVDREVKPDGTPGQWRTGGIMIQRLPQEQGLVASDKEDDWRRAMVLMASVTGDELLSTDLAASDLLYRLFHEDGVRLFTAKPLRAFCRCSEGGVRGMLRSFPAEEWRDMAEADGQIHVTCEYCSRVYAVTPESLEEA
jgi:molecular chaperone Hsp33